MDLQENEYLDKNGVKQKRIRQTGYVVECDGMHAAISAMADPQNMDLADYWTVGQLITVNVGDVRTVGMLGRNLTKTHSWDDNGKNEVHIHVELVGEIYEDKSGQPRFTGGISTYPHMGSTAHKIRSSDLHAIFANNDPSAVKIGAVSQNKEIDALIAVDTMVSRHFAVVGTTGVGKSTSVSMLIRKVTEKQPDTAILVLDPHNEFTHSFDGLCVKIDESNLDLPFWLFKLEELVQVLYRGRPPIVKETDILRDLIPEAKGRFRGEESAIKKRKFEQQITADTPVPYRFADLIALVDERLGKLDTKDDRTFLKALRYRLQAAIDDPRYRFMFASKTIHDSMSAVLSQIFRVPTNGKPITVLELSGIPSEVVNAVVSVLCRMAFDLAVWSQGKCRTLVLCEEAHRYIPQNQEAGFGPTRSAIGRIAKEGRKYGVSLGLVTQRPSELDETILSQCNTIFAMRLGNERDQEIMRKAISGASRSYINFLPSLANRECIAFGQGVSTPMRLTFSEVPASLLPGGELSESGSNAGKTKDGLHLDEIIQAMRFPRSAEEEDEYAAAPMEQAGGQAGEFVEQAQSTARLTPQGSRSPFDTEYSLRRNTDHASSGDLAQHGRRYDDPMRPSRPVASPPQPRASAPAPAPSSEPRTSSRDLISKFRR